MVMVRQGGVNPLNTVEQVVTRAELVEMQEEVSRVYIKDTVVEYVIRLIGLTRKHPQIQRGASPRATLAVIAMAKATAYMNDRDYVVPGDVKTVFAGTVAHRLLLTANAQAEGVQAEELLASLLSQVPSPGV